MLLYFCCDTRKRAIEEEGAKGRQDVEEYADRKYANELNLKWRVGQDKGRPSQVEQDQIEGGRIGGEGWDEEDGESGD